MNNESRRCNNNTAALLITCLAESPAVPIETRGLLYFGIFILITGLVSLIYPRFFWNIGIGRKAVIPPPSLYLTMLRLGGLLACAIAAAMLLNAFRY